MTTDQTGQLGASESRGVGESGLRQGEGWHLDPGAPSVPDGYRPRRGVEFGCGVATCGDCYVRQTAAPYGSMANPVRGGAR
jgi:hypothetical protein